MVETLSNGDTFTAIGDQLGGDRGTNDATVTVAPVDNDTVDGLTVPGVIKSLTVTGTPALTKWEIMSEGYSWKGTWKASATGVVGENDYVPAKYFINDLVERSEISRVQGHTATTDADFGFGANSTYWTLPMFMVLNGKTLGQHKHRTQVGDVVRNGGKVWRCPNRSI